MNNFATDNARDFLTSTLVERSRVVRDVAELYVGQFREAGARSTILSGWCAVVSAVLVEVLREIGVDATLVGGYVKCGYVRLDVHTGHYWVMCEAGYAGTWEDRCVIVDLTATQFPKLALPPVTILLPGDPRRQHYVLDTDDPCWQGLFGANDWADIDAMVAEVRSRLARCARGT